MKRLSQSTEATVHEGERGDEDALIDMQRMRADKLGDPNAMVAMGDLYYYGARGMPRDQAQAYDYFQRAANTGHTGGQVAAANLLPRVLVCHSEGSSHCSG